MSAADALWRKADALAESLYDAMTDFPVEDPDCSYFWTLETPREVHEAMLLMTAARELLRKIHHREHPRWVSADRRAFEARHVCNVVPFRTNRVPP